MSNGFGSLAPVSQRSSVRQGLRPTVDAEQVQQQWLSQFAELKDPRGLQGQTHAFLSIVLIAILATIGGATGWEDIEVYGESHQAWLATFLDLRHGIPHADTYRRVFERIEPEALQRCFLQWVNQVVEATGAQVVPIDGKSVKGSYERSKKQSALHLVSAWASEHQLLLGLVDISENSQNLCVTRI